MPLIVSLIGEHSCSRHTQQIYTPRISYKYLQTHHHSDDIILICLWHCGRFDIEDWAILKYITCEIVFSIVYSSSSMKVFQTNWYILTDIPCVCSSYIHILNVSYIFHGARDAKHFCNKVHHHTGTTYPNRMHTRKHRQIMLLLLWCAQETEEVCRSTAAAWFRDDDYVDDGCSHACTRMRAWMPGLALAKQ